MSKLSKKEKISFYFNKKSIQLLLGLFFSLGFFLLIAYNNMNKVLANPGFTVGKIVREIEGAKSTHSIVFEYEIKEKLLINQQNTTTKWSKRRLSRIKGDKYLVVYNKKQPNKSHMLNVKLWQKLGIDLSNSYSVDSLKKEGLISLFDF